MDATSTKILRLQNSGTGAVARFLGKLYPSLVRPHALHQSSVGQEHPFGTATGGFLVPPILLSSWPYVEPVFCEIPTAYLGTSPLGAPPLPDVAGAEKPALASQITARLALRCPPKLLRRLRRCQQRAHRRPGRGPRLGPRRHPPPLEPHPRHDGHGGSRRRRGGDGPLRRAPAPGLGASTRERPGPHLAGPLRTNPLP